MASFIVVFSVVVGLCTKQKQKQRTHAGSTHSDQPAYQGRLGAFWAAKPPEQGGRSRLCPYSEGCFRSARAPYSSLSFSSDLYFLGSVARTVAQAVGRENATRLFRRRLVAP